MRMSKLVLAVLLSGLLGACASWGGDGQNGRMFGRNAEMRAIAGKVIHTGANKTGARYIVVKDVTTGLRVYVPSVSATCVPGQPFKATGHLTRAEEADYDATFHGHLAEAQCG